MDEQPEKKKREHDRRPDFFRQLSEGLLEQLEELARLPGNTGLDCFEFLKKNGVKTSQSAVYRWLQDYRLEDRNRRATDLARQYLSTAKESDPTAVSEAALTKFEELVLEHLMGASSDDALELQRIGRAMKTGTGTRRELMELKRVGNAQLDKLHEAAVAKRAITPEDIAEARRMMFGGAQ